MELPLTQLENCCVVIFLDHFTAIFLPIKDIVVWHVVSCYDSYCIALISFPEFLVWFVIYHDPLYIRQFLKLLPYFCSSPHLASQE